MHKRTSLKHGSMGKKKASEELCTDDHKIPDHRKRNYCLARTMHDKVQGLMLSLEMQVIAEQLVSHF